MSTTLTQPTITIQATNVASASRTIAAVAGGPTSTNLTQRIAAAINKALRRNLESGPGGPAAQPANQQNIVPQTADVHLMGSLPTIFAGNRSEAKAFIDGIQAYIHLNRDVPGFTSPMKKIALTLTLMQGEKVAGWVHNMGQALDELNPATNNIPALWDAFLTEF